MVLQPQSFRPFNASGRDGGGALGGAPKGEGGSLAEHFVSCARLGRYLNFRGNGRFLISDDFQNTKMLISTDAQAVASICSRDELVARAALLPLAQRAANLDDVRRAAYEELFSLIERQTLSKRVRDSAVALLESGFREARIRELEAVLGDELNPARKRYRAFLATVKRLIEKKVTTGTFIDDFVDFTGSVAGRLDFGIYSFCLDRLFATPMIPLSVKKLLSIELLGFPPTIRRELLSNTLANRAVDIHLKAFIRCSLALHMPKAQAVEIELLEAVKERRISPQEIEAYLSRSRESQDL